MSARSAVRLPGSPVRPFTILPSLAAVLLAASVFLATSPAQAAQPPVGLGTADSFAVLAGSGITNTGPTTITGDVGTFPTPSETGFASVTLTGANHAGDAVTQGAKVDLVTAYNDAAGRNPVTNVPVELGGKTLLAGVYTSPTFGLTGTLTLDAKGDPDAVFVFKAASTLIAESNSRVLLLNGANPCRVVWKVGSSATFKTGTRFVGDVLALTSITAQTAATFRGRLLARNGAVTLDTNTITRSSCVAPSGVGTTGGTGGSTGGTTGGTGGTTGGTGGSTGGTSGDTTGGTTGGSTGGSTGGTGGSTGGSDTPPGPDSSRLIPGAPSSRFAGPDSPTGPPVMTPGTPSRTPGTPDRPFLPHTGVEIVGSIAVGLALLALGTLVVTTLRRTRAAQAAYG